MPNKTKILSDLSKIAVDAMSTFSGVKNELETVIKLRVNKAINKMDLVRRQEFEVLKINTNPNKPMAIQINMLSFITKSIHHPTNKKPTNVFAETFPFGL